MKKIIIAGLIGAIGFIQVAEAQQKRPGERDRDRNGYLEQRVRTLEDNVNSISWRLSQLEQNGGGVNTPREWYCLAQCQNNSHTAAGGRGKSQSEAKSAAFDAVRKKWACQLEIVECTQEN